jgi:hypothetical protein
VGVVPVGCIFNSSLINSRPSIVDGMRQHTLHIRNNGRDKFVLDTVFKVGLQSLVIQPLALDGANNVPGPGKVLNGKERGDCKSRCHAYPGLRVGIACRTVFWPVDGCGIRVACFEAGRGQDGFPAGILIVLVLVRFAGRTEIAAKADMVDG